MLRRRLPRRTAIDLAAVFASCALHAIALLAGAGALLHVRAAHAPADEVVGTRVMVVSTRATSRRAPPSGRASARRADTAPPNRAHSRTAAMAFAGVDHKLRRGQGYLDVVSSFRDALGRSCHRTRYHYLYPDGHVESGEPPWPFCYERGADPLLHGNRRVPLQPPPPDFRPAGPLPPQLQQFFAVRPPA